MAYMCNKCLELYGDREGFILTENSKLPYEVVCPKLNCTGRLFKIDELMIPIIQNLNKKGYRTKYCCSGHYTERDSIRTYIVFDEEVMGIPPLPEDFIIEKKLKTTDTIVVRYAKYITDIDPNNLYEQLLDINNKLYKWSKNIPLYKEFMSNRRVGKIQSKLCNSKL